MPTILIVEKIGTIKELNVKTFIEEDLYKKAGFKTAEGFKSHTTWEIDGGLKISAYGKTSGKANQENKYEFPPPLDNTLFFGNCIIACKSEKGTESITAKDWEGIYETLYGGFEDIGEEDSNEDDEDDEDDGLPRTKSGYVKDDFVVDDLDESEEEEDQDEEDDDDDGGEVEYVKKPKKKAATSAPSKRKPTGKKTLFEKINTAEDPNTYLDCTNELEEEEYL
jgi:hypothetical protein